MTNLKKRGRPRHDEAPAEDSGKSVLFKNRDELTRRLEKMAKENGRSFANQVRLLVQKSADAA